LGCVDTSFLVALERRDGEALEKLRVLADLGEVVFISALSVAECYRGAYGSRDRAKALSDVKELLELFAVLNFDYESGRKWGELAESMKSSSIGDRDLFIACITLVNGQSVLTRNRKHFERVPGLVVEDW
jgi:tRNA(fMet)-specific endonuclease VapC